MLMLLPVVLLVFGLAGSLVVFGKRNMEIGGKGCKYLACHFAASLVRRCFTSGQHTIAGLVAVRQQESTLAIRAVHQGTTIQTVFQSGITLTLTAFLSKVYPQKRHSVNYL